MTFTRRFEDLDQLKDHKLFKKRLLPDIKSGAVFPAIRDNAVDFYYGGGRLFRFERNTFKTHIKYATVIEGRGQYISEKQLENASLSTNFCVSYEAIKKNCALYAGSEAAGLSHVLKSGSFTQSPCPNIVVLDVEISFQSGDAEKQHDRIDLLLFDTQNKVLRFVEAKEFANKELWSLAGTRPKVCDQIERYEAQIGASGVEIIEQYQNTVSILNDLLSMDLPLPETVEPRCQLLIFGFDQDQRDNRLQRLLLQDEALEGLWYYACGNEKQIEARSIWTQAKEVKAATT